MNLLRPSRALPWSGSALVDLGIGTDSGRNPVHLHDAYMTENGSGFLELELEVDMRSVRALPWII